MKIKKRKGMYIMISKTVTYKDFNGTERTETFYFNFTKAEILDMETGITGGLSGMIQKIIDTKDVPTIMATFKKLVIDSYGEKSADGRRFIKSKEVKDAFTETEAYSQIYMELSTNAEMAGIFANGIIPADTGATGQPLAVLPKQ